MKTLPYGRHDISDEDIAEVVAVLKSDFLTQGPRVEAFERDLAKVTGAKHVVAVTNGTAALHLAAMSLGTQEGDWALCASNTFAASANCIRYCGGEVEFVDIDPKTYCLDPNQVEDKIRRQQRKYKGIVAVDFAGYPAEMSALREIADRYGVWILEDSCHALGARLRDADKGWVTCGNGTLSDCGIFSFHPVKHIATGEGGAIATQRDDLAARARMLRTHGITKVASQFSDPHGGERGWYYEMQELGLNYRIPDLNAALGSAQLRRLNENLRRRHEIAERYDQAFVPKGLARAFDQKDHEHARHLYVIEVANRFEVYRQLHAQKILAQVHYIPVHMHPYYRRRYPEVRLPQTETYYERTLSLPIYPTLTDADVDRVIEAVLNVAKVSA